MDTMDLEQIHKKLQTDWADWTDDDQCISICKKELMASMQAINAYIVRYDLKTRIEEDPTSKSVRILREHIQGALNQFAKNVY